MYARQMCGLRVSSLCEEEEEALGILKCRKGEGSVTRLRRVGVVCECEECEVEMKWVWLRVA